MPGPVILASDVNSAASGGRYVAFQSSGYVQVATNRIVGAPEYTDAAVLEGRNLNDIDYSQIVRAPNLVLPPPPPVSVSGEAEPFPTTPPTPAGRTALPAATAHVAGNMDLANLLDIDGVEVDRATATNIDIDNGYVRLTVSGTGFVYDEDDDLVAGIVSSVSFVSGLHDRFFSISLDFNVVPPPVSAVVGPLTQQVFAVVLAGDDAISGGSVINGPGSGTDLLRGYDGNDLISGGGGNDTIFGGTGDDVIYAVAGSNLNRETGSTYLRGDDGADFIVGGLGFDDANGNIGNDTVTTGAGDDYCVGGKDSDLLYGEAGQDIVYGNLGNDSCDGGDGNDIVRGGQDNDVVRGGAGDDFVSGDKGSDTMTGGLGADIFHTFGDAGVDRVTDFSLAQGDRVQLDPGTQYTVSQVGADTVINMTGGGQMVLVGVQMSSLTPGWIFGA
jgi:Ca2+-binding RTX toxin-like protein